MDEAEFSLEKHLKDIDDHFKHRAMSPMIRNPEFQVEVFDLNGDNLYRVYKDLKKMLVWYKHPNVGTTKSFELTQEQVDKLENYLYT
jgi:hypothetical protein